MKFMNSDIVTALLAWRLWLTWSWVDLRQRYRRSRLGTFWLTLSLGITICGLSFVFSGLFGQDIKILMPHIATGMIGWTLITGMVNDSCLVFINADRVIKQIHLPYTSHVLRHLMLQYFTFFHHIVIAIVVALIFSVEPTIKTLLVFPALALYFINGIWVGLLLGMVCTRFRDVPQIITSAMQLIFFVTPIFWKPGFLTGRRRFIIDSNPLYHYLEILRQPLLGGSPTLINWAVVLAITTGGLVVTVFVFRRFGKRIPYWL